MISATVVPIHPPKYRWAIKFLDAYKKYATTGELYFVFSSQADLDIFKKHHSREKKFKHIIVEEKLPSDNAQIKATFKKLYAINKLAEQGYKYVGVLDCDSVIVRQYDSDKIYHDIYHSKIIKTNLSTGGSNIIKLALEKAYLLDDPKLIDIKEQYMWFNDICVFEKDTFIEFYYWLKQHDNFKEIQNTAICFDYIIYSLWLVANKDFKFKLMDDEYIYPYGAIEHNFDDDDLSYKFKSSADANRNWKNIDHIKVLIHLDRSKNSRNSPKRL